MAQCNDWLCVLRETAEMKLTVYLDLKSPHGYLAVRAAMGAAEESGFVGVPHYVFTDPVSERTTGLYGREHLALIRSKLMNAGLAR